MLIWIEGTMKQPPNPKCSECYEHIADRHINGGEPCHILLRITAEVKHETAFESEAPIIEVVRILCGKCYKQGKG